MHVRSFRTIYFFPFHNAIVVFYRDSGVVAPILITQFFFSFYLFIFSNKEAIYLFDILFYFIFFLRQNVCGQIWSIIESSVFLFVTSFDGDERMQNMRASCWEHLFSRKER